jgi:hypothetical protein
MKHGNDNSNNVIKFNPSNELPDADTVLFSAMGVIKSSVVIGMDKEDESVYVASSEKDLTKILGLIDVARHVVMGHIRK